MRVDTLSNQYRLRLNEHDYLNLLEVAHDHDDPRRELAVRLGGEMAMRVSEIHDTEPGHVRESTHPDVTDKFLVIPHAKDTSGKTDDGKRRDCWMPTAVHEHHRRTADELGVDEEEKIFDVSKRTLQAWLKRLGEATADKTGVEDWRKFSAHDLRAFCATNWLVRYDINPEVVKECGGWEDYQSLKPYVANPTDDLIAMHYGKSAIDDGYRLRETDPVPEPEETTEREQATIDTLVD